MTSLSKRFIPRVKDIYEIVPSSEGMPHVRSGDEVVLKVAGEKGRLLGMLLLAIDGQKAVEQLVQELGEIADRPAVSSALDFLVKEGIVEDASATDTSVSDNMCEEARYLSHYLSSPADCLLELARKHCHVISNGGAGQMVASDLAAHGFGHVKTEMVSSNHTVEAQEKSNHRSEGIASADIVVMIMETFLPQLCREVNRLCLGLRKPVLFADLSSGNHDIIGPFCVPGQTSCYSCYEARVLANTDAYREHVEYESFVGTVPFRKRPFGRLKALDRMATALLVLEVLSYVTGYRAARTIDGTLIIDLFESEIYREPVLKLPDCKECAGIQGLPVKRC